MADGDQVTARESAAQPSLCVVPIGLRAANAFVGQEHRHHPPSRGHKFSISVVDEAGDLRGVAIAGRPVSRHLDDGRTLEALRVATDGCPNACSALYGAVARVGSEMGYRRDRIITYTLASEPGTSLRAAGWVPDHTTKGEGWDRPGRARDDDHHPTEAKVRWRAAAPPATPCRYYVTGFTARRVGPWLEAQIARPGPPAEALTTRGLSGRQLAQHFADDLAGLGYRSVALLNHQTERWHLFGDPWHRQDCEHGARYDGGPPVTGRRTTERSEAVGA